MGFLGRAQAYHEPLALAQQFLYGPLLEQLALLQNGHAVAHLLDLVEDMAGEENRLANRRETQDQLAHLVHAGGIEAVLRLRQQDQLGVAQQGRAAWPALLHAPRVLAIRDAPT